MLPPLLHVRNQRRFQPELSSSQRSGAKKFYQNEKKYSLAVGNGQYRSEAEIMDFFRKIKKIEVMSKSCGIPVKEISAEKYYELTGENFN